MPVIVQVESGQPDPVEGGMDGALEDGGFLTSKMTRQHFLGSGISNWTFIGCEKSLGG